MAQAGWRSRNLGAGWQFAFFHGLIRAGGRRLAYLLSDFISLWYVLTRPSVRRRCRPYLSHRFPRHGGWRRLLDTWHLSRAFAHILVDRATMTLLGKGEFDHLFEGREALLSLAEEGKGLIIVTAHVGAWQLGMASLGVLNRPTGIVARMEPTDRDNPFQTHTGDAQVFEIIDPAGDLAGVPRMLAKLDEGGVLCIMGDRVLGAVGGTVEVQFLGESMRVPYSPYRIASATGAPVAVLFPHKADQNRYALHLAATLRIPEDLGRKAEAYQPYAQAFADALATFLDKHPYHFFNFFDLWHPEETEIDGSGPR